MCGIVGIAENNSRIIFDMLDALSNRGPDSKGTWQSAQSEMTLGHARLSIVDLTPAGNQPMVSNDGRYVLTYNGEIYNHKILKQQLEEEFHLNNWRGTSDTEVLLTAIEMWGLKNCLHKLDGMFAFALFDSHLKTLTLVRDHFGEKPLFFSWLNEKLAFASQIISLEQSPHLNRDLNKNAVHDCLSIGYSRGLDTFYESTYRLPAGSFIEFNYADFFVPLSRDIITKKLNYYTKAILPTAPQINNYNAIDAIKLALEENVSSRLIADVPIGIFLSGGIDSSLITAISQKLTQGKIRTYTIGFKQKSFDEAPYARVIAEHLKTDHHELYIEEDEILARIIDLPNIIDEPFGDTSIIPSSFLCEFARKDVKVALAGDGGDELFGGYSRYLIGHNIARFWGLAPSSARKYLALLDQYLFKNRAYFCTQSRVNVSAIIKSHRLLHRLLSTDAQSLNDRFVGAGSLSLSSEMGIFFTQTAHPKFQTTTITQEMMAYDQRYYLPDNILVKSDRSSMAYGLEVRSPFLSKSLLNISKQLQKHELICQSKGKVLLRELLMQYLPVSLFDRPKSGFSPPLGEWLRGPLYNWSTDLLNEEHLYSLPGVDAKYTTAVWDAHCKKHFDASFSLWPLLMYANWSKNRR